MGRGRQERRKEFPRRHSFYRRQRSTASRIIQAGLRERGYTEGKNIILIYRYAEGKGERLADLAAELVREKVDVIVTTASSSALAARRVTQTLPIVMTTGNPLAPGLADSLAKPGGNVTGLSVMPTDLSVKRLELLKESFPNKTRIAVLWSPRDREAGNQFKETSRGRQSFVRYICIRWK
jgi:putative ABC transport system substrate-binding protein